MARLARSPLLPACVGALAVACSSGPDILASRNGSAYLDASVIPQCRAGTYEGNFVNLPGSDDSGTGFAFSGTLTFTLVASPNGEFLDLLDNAHLEGTSQMPIPNAQITATLRALEPCKGGHIATEFQGGVYASQQFGVSIPFTGGAEGDYYPSRDGFIGSWTAQPGTGRTLVGSWVALRVP